MSCERWIVCGREKLLCRSSHDEERQIVRLVETFAEATQIAEALGDESSRIGAAVASRQTLNPAEAVFLAGSISGFRQPVGIQE